MAEEVITVRVEKSLKEKIKKHKINVSKTVRNALEDEIKKKEQAELIQAITEMKSILQNIPDEEIVKAIRESRDQR
jgi:post-segregation antitoxin (ccd killing protein)